MIEVALRIIEHLIDLLRERKKTQRKLLRTQIEGVYKDAELIVNDYLHLFADLIKKLQSEEDVVRVIRWVEERRLDLLPLRVKLRAFLRAELNITASTMLEVRIVEFAKSVLDLMQGGLSVVSNERHFSVRAYTSHTVLSVLYEGMESPMSKQRDSLIQLANLQLLAVQNMWEHVSSKYADVITELA